MTVGEFLEKITEKQDLNPTDYCSSISMRNSGRIMLLSIIYRKLMFSTISIHKYTRFQLNIQKNKMKLKSADEVIRKFLKMENN